jgi:hypothetical protein
MFNVKDNYEVKFKKGDRIITHTLRQPKPLDVYLFEKKSNEPMKLRDGTITQDTSLNKAFAYLWDLLVEKVDGYDFTGKNWKEKVPVMDRIKTVRVFNEVRSWDEADVKTEFGKQQIIKKTDGSIVIYVVAKQYGGKLLMAHIFNQPTIEDVSEFERVSALSKIQPKKNRVEVTYLPTTDQFCDLYDRLIDAVKGYDLGKYEDLSTVLEMIPALHKVVALKELFSEIREELEEIEGN